MSAENTNSNTVGSPPPTIADLERIVCEIETLADQIRPVRCTVDIWDQDDRASHQCTNTHAKLAMYSARSEHPKNDRTPICGCCCATYTVLCGDCGERWFEDETEKVGSVPLCPHCLEAYKRANDSWQVVADAHKAELAAKDVEVLP